MQPLSSPQIVYDTYAGVDIVAELVVPGNATGLGSGGNEAPLILGELQTISYSMHRENYPVRLLGHTNPVSHLRGPRTVAGSLIFTVFNQYAFYRLNQFKALINKGIYPLADMLPPFDVAISFMNESGSQSQMRIYGVTIIDEGQTMSIDDLVTEQTYTYLAQGIVPMTSQATAVSAPLTHLPNNFFVVPPS